MTQQSQALSSTYLANSLIHVRDTGHWSVLFLGPTSHQLHSGEDRDRDPAKTTAATTEEKGDQKLFILRSA